jgi:magnesium-transporting ATPase (P-type)
MDDPEPGRTSRNVEPLDRTLALFIGFVVTATLVTAVSLFLIYVVGVRGRFYRIAITAALLIVPVVSGLISFLAPRLVFDRLPDLSLFDR